MKKFSRKFAITLLIFSRIGIAPSTAGEISDIDPYADGKLSLVRCISKGGIDFGLLLDALIWNDKFLEGVIEPWNDVLKRNQCQSNDIISLIKQQDKLRGYIRDAFLTCNTQKLPALKKANAKLTAEIYYVRHIVDGGLVLSLPYDLLTLSRFRNAVVADSAKLKSEMSARYVRDGFLTSTEFEILFRNLEFKYTDRKEKYIICEYGSWQTVSDKWKEFVESGYGFGVALKEAGQGIANRADKLGKEIGTIKTVELFTTDLSLTEYVSSFGKINLNRLEPDKGFDEIIEMYKKQAPSFLVPGDEAGPGPGLTQAEMLDAIVYSDRIFEIDELRTDMSSKFANLYFEVGDGSVGLFIDNLDGRGGTESLKNTEGLIEIIDDSFPKLNGILQKTKTMNDRQCPGG